MMFIYKYLYPRFALLACFFFGFFEKSFRSYSLYSCNNTVLNSNLRVNKVGLFLCKSYNFTVDKATENWHIVDFLLLVQVAFCAIMFISFVHLVPEKEALAIRLFFFFPYCAPVTG